MRSTCASAAHHRESISACQPDVRCSKPYCDIEVTDYACPQHSCAPRGRACGEQESPCPNRVRPVRPLDEAVLTIRETPPHRTPARGLSPARGNGRRMTYGTSANTYLVGRRPSRSSPHRRSRTAPIGRGPAIQHMRRGLMAHTALMAHIPPWNLARHPPNHLQRRPPKRTARETSFASAAWKPAPHRGKMLKLISQKF
jgi:hypothetical protein